jgi:hypothetical protein
MGTNCAPLLAELFLYSYEADFIQRLLKKNEKKLARSFNFTFRYMDDALLLNNSWFGDFVDRIYTIELKIKDTADAYRSASNFLFFTFIFFRHFQNIYITNTDITQQHRQRHYLYIHFQYKHEMLCPLVSMQ